MNIDNCIGSRGSHYDISLYIFETLKEIDYKYKEKDKENDKENINYLKNYIKSVIVNDFIKRSFACLTCSSTSTYLTVRNTTIDIACCSIGCKKLVHQCRPVTDHFSFAERFVLS